MSGAYRTRHLLVAVVIGIGMGVGIGIGVGAALRLHEPGPVQQSQQQLQVAVEQLALQVSAIASHGETRGFTETANHVAHTRDRGLPCPSSSNPLPSGQDTMADSGEETGQQRQGMHETRVVTELDRRRAAGAPQQAQQLIDDALRNNRWTQHDRDRLAMLVPYLGADALVVRGKLIAALNSGRLRVEPGLRGMPF